MTTDPPPTQWMFPDPQTAAEDFVGIGADLEPATILSAYRRGLFPMPLSGMQEVGWWSPEPRGVLPLGGLRVSRSMRQSARRFTVSSDQAFMDVVVGCADPARQGGWIDTAVATAYGRLHELGWAHSVEVWRGGRLAGGLYGLAIGGLFAGESMFHRETDASKVALMALVELLDDEQGDRLLDVQWATPHLVSLGAVEIPRREYLRRLKYALEVPLPRAWR